MEIIKVSMVYKWGTEGRLKTKRCKRSDKDRVKGI